jgi:hypothetical protein
LIQLETSTPLGGRSMADPPVTVRASALELSRQPLSGMMPTHVYYFLSTDLMTKSYRCEPLRIGWSDGCKLDAPQCPPVADVTEIAMLTAYQHNAICVSKQLHLPGLHRGVALE